ASVALSLPDALPIVRHAPASGGGLQHQGQLLAHHLLTDELPQPARAQRGFRRTLGAPGVRTGQRLGGVRALGGLAADGPPFHTARGSAHRLPPRRRRACRSSWAASSSSASSASRSARTFSTAASDAFSAQPRPTSAATTSVS